MDLTSAKTYAEIFQALATGSGIVIGGIWTYLWVIRRRQRFPRASVTHSTNHVLLPDRRMLLRVAARVANTGEVLLCLRFARIRIQQLSPVPEHIAALMRGTADPVATGEHELPWTVLGAREWSYKSDAEIEPGETEVLHCDFVVPAGVEQVLLYTYVSNHAKRGTEIGWSDTTIVSLGC